MVAAGEMNLAGAVFMNGSAVQARPQHVKVGLLTCHASSGFGLMFGTTRDVNCALHVDAGKPQSYVGHIESFGFDAGYTEAGVLIWAVLAPTTTPGPGALAGTYETHPGSTLVGESITSNVLTGGLEGKIVLPPLDLKPNTNVNNAAGIAKLTLTHQP